MTAVKDANVYLAENDSGSSKGNYYRFCMGCWSNSKSVIIASGTTVATHHGALLSTVFYNAFWISWSGGLIRAGTGDTVGNNVIMSYSTSSPYAVKYILLQTNHGGSPGDWRFIASGNECLRYDESLWVCDLHWLWRKYHPNHNKEFTDKNAWLYCLFTCFTLLHKHNVMYDIDFYSLALLYYVIRYFYWLI